MIDVRRSTVEDASASQAVVVAADAALARETHREPDVPPPVALELWRRRTVRAIERDPEGCWVAVDGGRVVGMTQAVRRGRFWGLSMLFVHPDAQSRGVGRLLLEAGRPYAAGAGLRMIMTSPDPRALRRYSAEGLAIHPAVDAAGAPDRSTLPAGLRHRDGDESDLDLVAAVDAGLRGSRAEDVASLLAVGSQLRVVDDGPRRGWVLSQGGRVGMLGASDERTASELLWAVVADGPGSEDSGSAEDTPEQRAKVRVNCLTARQDWAVRVALAARISVTPTGPLFVDGMPHPPGPWLPSGWYF